MRVIIVAILALASVGCSYNAQVVSTSAAASEIRTDRVRPGRAGVYVEDEISNLQREVSPSSYVCSAHNYPLEIGSALKNSIRSVVDSSFEEMEFIGSSTSTNGNPYTFVFSLDDFSPNLSFAAGFWQGNATANVEIVMKVSVLDREGNEILRTTIAGEGTHQGKGGCGDGAQVLADAGREAIKRMLENFVYKVINSDQLDA